MRNKLETKLKEFNENYTEEILATYDLKTLERCLEYEEEKLRGIVLDKLNINTTTEEPDSEWGWGMGDSDSFYRRSRR